MRIRSIGARLTFWYAGILCVTLLVLGGTAYGFLAYSLSHDVDAALEGVAKVSAEQARAQGSTFFPRDVDELFRHYLGFSPLNPSLELFDTQGRPDLNRPGAPAGRLPLSPKALKDALHGVSTFETIESPGPYPFRVLTMPVIKSGTGDQSGSSRDIPGKCLQHPAPLSLDYGGGSASRPVVGDRGWMGFGQARPKTGG